MNGPSEARGKSVTILLMVGGNHELLDGKRQTPYPQTFHLGESKRRSRCRDHVTFQRPALQRRCLLRLACQCLKCLELATLSQRLFLTPPTPPSSVASLPPGHQVLSSADEDCLVFFCMSPLPCLTHLPEPCGLSLLSVWKRQHFLPIILPALLRFGERFSGILRLQHDTAQAHSQPPEFYRRKV